MSIEDENFNFEISTPKHLYVTKLKNELNNLIEINQKLKNDFEYVTKQIFENFDSRFLNMNIKSLSLAITMLYLYPKIVDITDFDSKSFNLRFDKIKTFFENDVDIFRAKTTMIRYMYSIFIFILSVESTYEEDKK